MSCVRCDEITVRGHEGGDAVINCTCQKGDESIQKYLRKGESKDHVVIWSKKGKEWTHKERVSLQDKKDIHIFTVTIRKLTPEDAGIYWCGVKKWGGILYTRVNLTVDRKPNKPTAAIPTVTAEVTTVTNPNTVPVSKPNKPTAAIPTVTADVTTVTLPNTVPVTAEVTTVTLPNTPVSTHNATTAPLTNITESDSTSAASGVSSTNATTRTLSNITERTTHLQSDQNQKSPTSGVSTHNATTRTLSNITERTTHLQSDQNQKSPTSSGHLAVGLVVVAVVIIALLVVTFRLMKRRAEKKRALPTSPSGNIRPDSCVYSEIQPTSPHDTDGPNQSDQWSSPALTSIYALATLPAPDHDPASAKAANQLPQPTTSNMQPANHLPQLTTAGDGIYYLATNPMPALHSCTTSATNQHCESGPATAATDSDDIYSLATNPTPALQTGASASSATNQQRVFDLANYSNITSANDNPDGSEYAMVVFSDEPIGSDSASFSKSGTSP
ncbi:mucin-2-like [Alosa alosa]|nr:mucin-2-like [Alosa alosa]